MEYDYTANAHYLTYTFILRGWENVLFEHGNESVKHFVASFSLSIRADNYSKPFSFFSFITNCIEVRRNGYVSEPWIDHP